MPDIIIVGGGVIGASIAYHLSKQTNKQILLLERDELNSHASRAAAGMLGAQAELTPDHPLFPLARASLEWFREHAEQLEEKSGIPLHLNLTGTIQLALNEDEWIQFQRRRKTWEELNVEVLEYSKIKTFLPSLSEEIRGGLWVPDGQLEAANLTRAWIHAAVKQGVEVHERSPVRSLMMEGEQVRGVITDQGRVEAEWVVVASGAWSNEYLPSHLQIPLIPVKGEALLAQMDQLSFKHTFFTKNAYLVPKQKNLVLVGATEHPHQMNEKASMWGISQLLNQALTLYPFLKEAQFVNAWAGVRPQTPDQLPVLGMSTQVQGLLYASGHYRNGILLSAITGKIAAELIEEGQASLDIASLSPERWR